MVIPRRYRVRLRPQTESSRASTGLGGSQDRIVRMSDELPGEARLDSCHAQVAAVERDSGDQPAEPIYLVSPNSNNPVECGIAHELLRLLPEVLSRFRSVDAVEPYADLTPVPKDADGVSIHHRDHATTEILLSGSKENAAADACCDDEDGSGCS
jgi:hypothetical protein